MKSFEEHLRGAKAHNREDKIWLVTCFSGKMAKLCAKYGFLDDEDHPLSFVVMVEGGGSGAATAGRVANTVLQEAVKKGFLNY